MPAEKQDFFKEVDEEEKNTIATRHKREDYQSFRREFDGLKRQHNSKCANSDNLKQQGNQFFQLECYEQASIMYSEAIELQPESAVIYCNRSMAYLKMELTDQALEDAETSLQIDSTITNIKAYWRKAQALLELKRYEESEAASDVGLELQPSNGHLNTVRKKAREAAVLQRLIKGEWVGKVQSGIEKRMVFGKDGLMTMHVFGHAIKSTFDLSVEGFPRSMLVKMKMEGNLAGSGPPPPPTPYIFEFHKDDEELWLCHPVNSAELPTKFEGPGFDKMARVESTAPVNDPDLFEPVDELCSEYITAMCKVLPVFPVQLPERPSDDEIAHEVGIAEDLSKLKRKFGVQVHRRAIGLAKDPVSAGCEQLEDLALNLQQRLIARRIIPAPEEKTASSSSAAPATGGYSANAEDAQAAMPKPEVIGQQVEACVLCGGSGVRGIFGAKGLGLLTTACPGCAGSCK